MDLTPPPNENDPERILIWLRDLYQWLQFPTFEQMRLIPRSSVPTDTSEGVQYHDSDDNKHKVHNGTDWQDTY